MLISPQNSEYQQIAYFSKFYLEISSILVDERQKCYIFILTVEIFGKKLQVWIADWKMFFFT